METKEILITDINVVENHRANIGETQLDELMQSIKQNGLQSPIGVARLGQGFKLIFGHRRLVACQKLGYKKIPAVIKHDVSDRKFTVLQLTENLQRKDPTFPEMGRSIETLLKQKMTFPEMAVVLGKPEKELKKIYRTYQSLPAKHRKNVKFMTKGGGDRNGGIPHTMAVQIAQIKKHRGLDEKATDLLVAHVQKSDMSKEVLTNLAVMLDQGLELDSAIAKMETYHVYHFDIVAPQALVMRLMQEHGCKSSGVLFKKIIYGLTPGIPKPDFIKIKD